MLSRLSRWQFFGLLVLLLLSTCRTAYCQSSQSAQEASPLEEAEPDQPEQKPSLLTPLKSQLETAPYDSITSRQRVRWILTNSVGPAHLAGGIFSAGFGTALDRPKEDGPHWAGFGELRSASHRHRLWKHHGGKHWYTLGRRSSLLQGSRCSSHER